jgi:multiple sugar transport system substrate-binding protein
VAKGLYADPASLEEGWKKQIIYPLHKSVQDSPDFVNNKSEFFNGQTANKDVYVPAGNAYKGTVYAPIQVYYYYYYYYAQLQAQLAKIINGKTTGDQAADDLQAQIKYAKSQGFNVTA